MMPANAWSSAGDEKNDRRSSLVLLMREKYHLHTGIYGR